MPIGDVAGEALAGVARLIGRFLFEIVFELMIRGTGYALLRTARPRSEPGETASAVAGLLFWGMIGGGIYFVYRTTSA